MPDLWDITVQVISAGGVIGAIFGTSKWAWVEYKKRRDAERAKIDRRFEKIENDLKGCQAREHTSERRAAVKLTAIELMWQEVDRLSPSKPNPTLRRVKKLLDSLKLPEPAPELDALAADLDSKKGKP